MKNLETITGMMASLDPGLKLSFWNRFKTRLLLWLILLSAITSSIAGYIFYARQLQFVKAEQKTRGRTLIRNLSGQSELGVYTEDHSFLIHPVRRAFEEIDVAYVAIFNRQGKRLIMMKKPGLSDGAKIASRLDFKRNEKALKGIEQKNKEDFVEFLAPIFAKVSDVETTLYGGSTGIEHDVLGIAYIGLSQEPARKKLREVLWAGIQVSLIILVLSSVLAVFLARRLAYPVLKLATGADTIRSGAIGYQIELNRSDEFGVLAESFNRMSSQLEDTIDTLNHLNRNLESEVNKRTEALVRSRDFISLLNAPLQVHSLLDSVLHALLHNIGAKAGAAYLYEAGRYVLANSQGALASTFIVDDVRKKYLDQAVEQEGALIVDPIIDESTLVKEIDGVKILICVPLFFRHRIQGVIEIAMGEPLQESDREFLEHAASQLAIAVANTRAYANVEHLARQLEQRNVALLQQRDQLQEVNQLKSEFLARVSHELRTPLNAIIGYAELINEGIYGPVNHDQSQSLEGIGESAESLLELINQILDLSKVEAGKMVVNSSEVDLVSLTKDVVESTSSLTRDRPYDLEFNAEVSVLPIVTDGSKVRQILVNLISNAVKFTDSGYVKVGIKGDSHQATISVIDSGIGINKEDLGIIFDEFRQVDGSTTRKHGGTGLGLAISQKLARLLGGEIEVKSEERKGSRFTLYLVHSRAKSADDETSKIELDVSVDERLS